MFGLGGCIIQKTVHPVNVSSCMPPFYHGCLHLLDVAVEGVK